MTTRILLCTALLCAVARGRAEPVTRHVVLAIGRDTGSFRDKGETATRFRETMTRMQKVAAERGERITFAVVTDFTGFESLGLDKLPKDVGEVHVIFSGHAGLSEGKLELAGAEGSNISTKDLGGALKSHHSNRGTKISVSLFCCMAGLADARDFPGPLFGSSPGDGVTYLSDSPLLDILAEAKVGRVPLPMSAGEAHAAWEKMSSLSRLLHWYSTGPDGEVEGVKMVGALQTPKARAARRALSLYPNRAAAVKVLMLSVEAAAREIASEKVRAELFEIVKEVRELPLDEQPARLRHLLDDLDVSSPEAARLSVASLRIPGGCGPVTASYAG